MGLVEGAAVDADEHQVRIETVAQRVDHVRDALQGGAVAQDAVFVHGEAYVEGLREHGLVPREDGAQLVEVGDGLEADQVDVLGGVEVGQLRSEVAEKVDLVGRGPVVAGELRAHVRAPRANAADQVAVLADALSRERDYAVQQLLILVRRLDVRVLAHGLEARLVCDGHQDVRTRSDEVAEHGLDDLPVPGRTIRPERVIHKGHRGPHRVSNVYSTFL